MLTDLILGAAHAGNQCFVLLGDQLDRHEQGGQGLLLGDNLRVAARVLLQRFLQFLQLFFNGAKAQTGYFRIRTAVAFVVVIAVIVVVVFILVVILGLFLVLGFGGGDFSVVGAGHAIVVRVDVTAEDVGQAATFFNHASVVGEDVVNGAGEHRDGGHHFANAFLDTLGDFDLAFAGQQFDGTHLTHVHAHRVGGTTNVGFNGGEGSGGFFGSGFVGVVVSQQQRVGVGCCFEHRDAHVVDHADNVFHLLRIGDILGQVIVDLRIGQIALFATTRDELFETGLLLRFSGHNNPCGCLGVQKSKLRIIP